MENEMFKVTGSFKIGDKWKPYTKTIEAPNEEQARERTYNLFGSKHRLPRRSITIATILRAEG
ncbi:MAG: 50S ribosomal protein L18Ae [Methanomicrobiales archaeon]|nr:50S ribosomal protein L18Ae [Methanomicrobiales archaeon]